MFTHSRRVVFAGLTSLMTAGLAAGMADASNVLVDLELSLLLDASGSISNSEFDLQLSGYEAAFRNATIINAITDGAIGQIAVNLIQWSGGGNQVESVGWTLINDSVTSNLFADAIDGVSRAYSGSTAPGSAIAFATPLFDSNMFDGTRQVIDVSGDGVQNDGISTSGARDAALLVGIDQINGIAIGNQTLVDWYDANIKGGTGAFVLQSTDFDTFGKAIDRKILREVGGEVPLPAPVLMLGAALGGLGFLRRSRG